MLFWGQHARGGGVWQLHDNWHKRGFTQAHVDAPMSLLGGVICCLANVEQMCISNWALQEWPNNLSSAIHLSSLQNSSDNSQLCPDYSDYLHHILRFQCYQLCLSGHYCWLNTISRSAPVAHRPLCTQRRSMDEWYPQGLLGTKKCREQLQLFLGIFALRSR